MNLYIVSTPIGNLQDITLRAANILLTIPCIITESPSKTSNLLDFLRRTLPNLPNDPNPPKIISFSEDEEENKLHLAIKALEDNDAALVCEAGTPLISDPGFKLVREVIKRGINIVTIPGPSAVIAALSVSGSPTDKFMFLGYLPRKEGKQKEILGKLKDIKNSVATTAIFYESPHRLVQSLVTIQEVFGFIDIVVCRELTKIYEEVRREPVADSIEHFKAHQPKGEFVILL